MTATKKDFDEFCEALLLLKTKPRMRDFLRDILTSSERAQISQRWRVTLRLQRQELELIRRKNRLEIAQEEDCSRDVVTRSARLLSDDATGVAAEIAEKRVTKR